MQNKSIGIGLRQSGQKNTLKSNPRNIVQRALSQAKNPEGKKNQMLIDDSLGALEIIQDRPNKI